MLRVRLCVFLSSCVLLLASCQGTKRTIYFTEDSRPDSNVTFQDIVQHRDPTIQANDIVAINIASISFASEDKPSQVFLNGGLSYAIGGNSITTGNNSFLVDSSGYIDYPRIGRIKLAGLSIPEAKVLLASQLKDYLKQPVLEVRIVNYRITMLGEVSSPGAQLVFNHKVTIIDAIANAGGIPITGRKDNVLIIREIDGRREFAHIDLNSRNVFNSPYYYLHQNDIVYVEPSRIRRQEGNEFLRFYLPTITTLISSALTAYALVQLANKQ